MISSQPTIGISSWRKLTTNRSGSGLSLLNGRIWGFLFHIGAVPWRAHQVNQMVVADSVLKMHLLSTDTSEVGSSFPYCKPMGIVSKSDLSVTEHSSMHDYIHVTGALLGNARSCNSRFISNSISRSDVCMAAMCIMATGAMKSGVQLDDDESRIINKATAKAMRLSVQEVKQIPDNVGVWIDSYNKDSSRIGLSSQVQTVRRGEEGQPHQSLVRTTFSSFSRPNHIEILVLSILFFLSVRSLKIYTFFKNLATLGHKTWLE